MLHLTYCLSILLFFQQSPSEIIDGYTDKLSAFPGDSVGLYLSARNPGSFHLKLIDMAGKDVASFDVPVFRQAPGNVRPYENGYGYKLTKRVMVPQLPSGVYLWDNQIPFIIKSRNAKITVVYPSNTANAYCNSGGKSLYGFNSTEKIAAPIVSFQRPSGLQQNSAAFLRWIVKEKALERVGYITDLDLDDFNTFKKSKLIIIAGHSEYWTLQARKNFDRFVQSGNNALILSGNTMWWQVRYNKMKDKLICYRDAGKDPEKSQRLKTINWSDSTLNYPIFTSIGVDFRYGGYGLKNDKGWNGYKIVKNSPLLSDTELKVGDILFCPSDETDGAPVLAIQNDVPLVDYHKLGFQKIEIVGYDLVVTRESKQGIATWIVFKANRSSGTVINTATNDWCSLKGIGVNEDIQRITLNMIKKLLNRENVFSDEKEVTHN